MLKKTVCLLTTILALTLANSAVMAQENPFMSLPDNRKNLNIETVPVSDVVIYDFLDYGATLQNKINSNWYPKTLKKKRNATVLLTLAPDGSIKGLKLQKSSNKKKFDLEIGDAIVRAMPFEALPGNLTKEQTKNIQINFVYDKKALQTQMISANIKDIPGYDEYIDQVEKTIASQISGYNKQYFCKKDVIFEIGMNKKGDVCYVKPKNSSLKDGFIRKGFNRKTIVQILNLKMPPIPDKMGVDEISIDYRVLTQRNRLFKNFIEDYVGNCFRTDIQSYTILNPDSL